MNTNSKLLKIYLTIMIVLTATATALRSIACVINLDYASGFFTDKALITTANTIITVTVLGMFSYLFCASRINLRASFATSTTYVPTGVIGVATVFLGAKVISYVIEVSNSPMLFSDNPTGGGPLIIIGSLAAILAFLSIAHHFFNAFITESKAEIRAYFAIASIMFLALYAMIIYLDPTLSVGESSKILRLTAFLVSALFFLYEARISLGREMWRIYTAFGLAASALCAYTSIPAIITYYVKDALISSANEKSLVSIEEYLLLLALFIFIVARLWVTSSLQEDKENQLIKVLSDYAKDREEKVEESYKRYQEIFASKQLSIFDLYGGEIRVEDEDNEQTESETPAEDEKKEPMISDDAIYEAIFGKMPERAEEPEDAPEPEDERAPEEIAEKLLSSLDGITDSNTEDNKGCKYEKNTCN